MSEPIFQPNPQHKEISSTTTSNYQIDFQENNFSALFKKFVVFIDGSPSTVRTYRGSLKQWFLYLKENQINHPTSETVREYRVALQTEGKKATTIQNYIVAVKRFFEWTEAEHLYPNIARYIKGTKINSNFKKDYLTSNQARTILKSIDQSTIIGKRDFAMLLLMIEMGLRTIEVRRANIDDMRTSGDVTVLYVQGKGHLDHFVEIVFENNIFFFNIKRKFNTIIKRGHRNTPLFIKCLVK